MQSLMPVKVLALSLALAFSASCGDGFNKLKERGIDGPSFNVLDGKIILTLKLLKTPFPGDLGGTLPIPRTHESSLEVGPNVMDGGTLIQVHIDPDDIRGVEVADDPNTLPDGRPLPGIPGGTLPSLRIDTELFNTTFYFHQKLFGFYVPFHFNTYGLSAYYTITLNGVDTGMVGIVKSDNEGRNSGLVIFLRLDALKQPQVQRLLQKSRQNPSRLY
jgi:hypothetical protein